MYKTYFTLRTHIKLSYSHLTSPHFSHKKNNVAGFNPVRDDKSNQNENLFPEIATKRGVSERTED